MSALQKQGCRRGTGEPRQYDEAVEGSVEV